MSYEAQARQVARSIGAIVEAAKDGLTWADIPVVMGELMAAAPLLEWAKGLPASERDDAIAAFVDAMIGTDETALVTKVGSLEGDALEEFTDALKAAVLIYVNARQAAA